MDKKDVPYIVFESSQVRMERTNRRLWILCIFLIIAFIVTNAGWIYYESQWQISEDTNVTQDISAGDGEANIIGLGSMYGTNKAKNH